MDAAQSAREKGNSNLNAYGDASNTPDLYGIWNKSGCDLGYNIILFFSHLVIVSSLPDSIHTHTHTHFTPGDPSVTYHWSTASHHLHGMMDTTISAGETGTRVPRLRNCQNTPAVTGTTRNSEHANRSSNSKRGFRTTKGIRQRSCASLPDGSPAGHTDN